jgi:hypothetical protein
MAILEEANLLAERARHAKHRTHHVGTKLNEGELHEFEALAEKRKQSPSGQPGDMIPISDLLGQGMERTLFWMR